jgi:hypothetical protein
MVEAESELVNNGDCRTCLHSQSGGVAEGESIPSAAECYRCMQAKFRAVIAKHPEIISAHPEIQKLLGVPKW